MVEREREDHMGGAKHLILCKLLLVFKGPQTIAAKEERVLEKGQRPTTEHVSRIKSSNWNAISDVQNYSRHGKFN